MKKLKFVLLFWNLFIGLGAVMGACMMFYDVSGKTVYFDAFDFQSLLPMIQKLPFSDVFFQSFLIPAIALLVINGISNLISFCILLRNTYYGSIAGMTCGIVLMLWISIQFIIFPFNEMSTMYFIFGILQFLTAYFLWKKIKSVNS